MLGKNNKNSRRNSRNNSGNIRRKAYDNNDIRKFDTRQKKQYVSRRIEVYGIIIVMISVLFFLSFFSFGRTGIITNYVNDYLSYLFGITKYIIAVLLFIWGISFFLNRIKYLPSRFGWGFFLIYVSIAGLLSHNFEYANIFDSVLVKSRGGIIGAGIFYGLFKLVSKAGAVTILAVILIIGILIVTKISLIDIIKRITALASRKKPAGGETGMEVETNIAGSKKPEINTAGKITGTELPEIISYDDKKLTDKKVFDAEKVSQPGYGTYEDKQIDGKKDLVKQLRIPLTENKETDQNYKLPPLSILKRSDALSPKLYKQSVSENVNTLNQLFYYFNLPAKVTSVTRGPSITLYELALSQGVRVQKLLSLEDDFCVALGSPDLRFLTPIPGKSAIGIEVPNKIRSLVTLGDIFSPDDKTLMNDPLAVPLGKNFSGEVVNMSINSMPHILIAGATNSGKSSCLNSIIVSLLLKVKPSEVKFIMIDPKMVELSLYNGIPHLLAPVIVDPKKAANLLSWVLDEMKIRFQTLLDYNCKSITEYNFMVSKDAGKESELKPMPTILVVIDELADLMMVAASEVEDSICRVAQMARAVGIHLIISTQKPVVKILTGLIKTNIPARIAFRVTDYTDSRVILEHGGAEKLIGRGDMLYLSPSANRPERLQGAFVTTKEISLITNYIKNQGKAEFNPEITGRITKKEEKSAEDDELFYDALKVVVEFGHASASLLQRKLRLGYSRAARIVDQLEEKGLIGSYDGSKPREVLISREELNEMLEGREN
ncbi:MAG: DNA translocase FtsK [Actinobacteria bacterium]|nr:DNA translocase FtsK [Actinomycetota bacterium]MCL5071969.1 DNA translocase FtsK [Actinomycetota bacterium]